MRQIPGQRRSLMLQRGGVDTCLAERQGYQKGVRSEPRYKLYVHEPTGPGGFPCLGRFDALFCWPPH